MTRKQLSLRAASAALFAVVLMVSAACSADRTQVPPDVALVARLDVASIYCDEMVFPDESCEPAPGGGGGGGTSEPGSYGSAVGITGYTNLGLPGFSITYTNLTDAGRPQFTSSGAVTSSRGGRIPISYSCDSGTTVTTACSSSQTIYGLYDCRDDYWTGSVSSTHTGFAQGRSLGPVYSNSGTQTCGSPPPPPSTGGGGGGGGGSNCHSETWIVEISYDGGSTWYEIGRFNVTVCG